MSWPVDADGDVLRRMQASGFDFDLPCLIDFNVEFESWPPASAAIAILEKLYPPVKVYEETDDYGGYLQFQVVAKLSYALVTQVQAEISRKLAPYGGVCDSWGVLH